MAVTGCFSINIQTELDPALNLAPIDPNSPRAGINKKRNKVRKDNLLGKIKNVKVIRDDGVSTWIKDAFAIMHNGCTAALEASFFKKPIVAFMPFKQNLQRKVIWPCLMVIVTCRRQLTHHGK